MVSMHSWITGHHVYKRVWTPVVGETLNCRRYRGNPVDPTAIGVFKGATLVGHVPREVKEELLVALRQGSVITATITGPRENSRHRGLEVPVVYHY